MKPVHPSRNKSGEIRERKITAGFCDILVVYATLKQMNFHFDGSLQLPSIPALRANFGSYDLYKL